MFNDYANLRPWKGAAEILAKDDSWGTLYDLEQLSKNEVKISAVSYVAQCEKIIIKNTYIFFSHRYYDDMYVDFDLARETASKIKNMEQYITNQLAHYGIRENPQDVISTLFKLSKREYN